ncbi:protein bric-a-brac 2-like isoform X1 [Euwallacea similis]|uniref:protein bric-a-brac 2-like isoform X1 n=1 Tax=Euwallacea similis TaxID=1736056 RepID=UPI003450D9F5
MSTDTTTEQFSLRWNNFHSNLKSGFHDLLQQAEMVDVTLAVEGHFLQAHKVVLSICSPYFKQMFKTNPCKHPIVILKDVGHENMKDILQFMYMGEVSVLRENLSVFLRTAEVLQVKGLTGDDPGEETCSQPKENNKPEDSNDLYEQLIETTSDVDMPQYSQSTPPPQTSPLPLNCPKKQSKTSSSPSNASKRLKISETYSGGGGGGGYNRLLLKTEESDMPKPSVDYNSCDFTNATQVRDLKPVVGEVDEAKDYSKSAERVWKGENVPLQAHIETIAGMSGGEQGSSEQGTNLPTKSEHRSVFKHGYQCEQCLKRFSRRDHLRTHEKNIHGSDAGPFKCLICEQLYKNTESLRKHISKFHFTNLSELVNKVEVKA